MAVLACEPKVSRMDFRLRVTVSTFPRGSLVNLPHMTSQALDLVVFAFQGEELSMIKVLHAINPIMTLEAITSKLSLVLIDKSLIIRSMAINAVLHGKFIQGN